ncbi:MAG: XRE family transcriptional regulator [Gammaproteobacteria bacterium]|nr:XRE family transcriptional regulator [Gammaproteobacteria bacterium]
MWLDEQVTRNLGDRLRVARDAAGMTQGTAAEHVDMSRTTLLAIEKGQRRVRLEELQRLALLYGTSVNMMLRRESVFVDLVPRFRRLRAADNEGLARSARLLSDLVRAEVELENILGIDRVRNDPPERPIQAGNVQPQAENDAMELRHRLGLGLSPIRDLVSILEWELGMRVYVRRLEASVSGVFAYDDSVGGCILLNASHPKERRTQSAAHEVGHFVATRREADLLWVDDRADSKEERYANIFARAFLTPARTVMQRFGDVTAGSSHLTRRHVILLAHFFGVSREAMVRRLEELGLTKSGTWDWFMANGGITNEHVRQVLGDLEAADAEDHFADQPTTVRLSLLAAEAWRRDLLSEGQLARLLCVDRLDVREILDSGETERGMADELPRLAE